MARRGSRMPGPNSVILCPQEHCPLCPPLCMSVPPSRGLQRLKSFSVQAHPKTTHPSNTPELVNAPVPTGRGGASNSCSHHPPHMQGKDPPVQERGRWLGCSALAKCSTPNTLAVGEEEAAAVAPHWLSSGQLLTLSEKAGRLVGR